VQLIARDGEYWEIPFQPLSKPILKAITTERLGPLFGWDRAVSEVPCHNLHGQN